MRPVGSAPLPRPSQRRRGGAVRRIAAHWPGKRRPIFPISRFGAQAIRCARTGSPHGRGHLPRSNVVLLERENLLLELRGKSLHKRESTAGQGSSTGDFRNFQSAPEDYCSAGSHQPRMFDSEEAGQLPKIAAIVDRKVRALARFERADISAPPQAVGGVNGRCRNRLRWSHVHVGACDGHHHRHRRCRRRAWVEVRRHNNREACRDHRPRVRVTLPSKRVNRCRQQHRLSSRRRAAPPFPLSPYDPGDRPSPRPSPPPTPPRAKAQADRRATAARVRLRALL